MRPGTPFASRPSRAAVVLAAAASGLLALSSPAAAADPPAEVDAGPSLADLELSFTGPATIAPGGTGSWRLDLRNADKRAATEVRVELELPDDVDVASVQPADGWSCVLAQLSCSLDGALPPGQAAAPLLVELAYASSAEGRRTVAALAYQGESSGAMRIDRAPAQVTVEPVGKPGQPAQQPGGSTEQVAAPAPVAPAPAPRRTTTTRTATTHTAAAPAPATAAEEPVTAAAEPAAPTEAAPEALPFADEPTPTPSASARSRRVAAPVEPADDGASGGLLALLGLGGLAAASGLAYVLVRARRTAAG